MTEREAYLAFSVFPGIGPVRFGLLTKYFGSAKDAWMADKKEWEKIHLPSRLLHEFFDFRRRFSIPAYITKLKSSHIAVLTISDKKYPKLLKEVTDAPFVLYVKSKKGMEKIDMDKTIAVVGTRKASPYGISVTKNIVTELVSYGCTIVSGMAYGIDAAAHEAAIEAGGKTIAVLGCGVDIIAPPTNLHIYKKLSDEGYGAVISEMPMGLRPSKGLFPSRNRIISGLSLGVLVVEGAGDSGALITAKDALDQGRDVFAIPGPITSPGSKATAILLKNGAALVEDASDIVESVGIAKRQKHRHNKNISHEGLGKEEISIVDILEKGSTSIDDIVRSSHLTIQTVSATLTVLEMKGIARDSGNKIYELAG